MLLGMSSEHMAGSPQYHKRGGVNAIDIMGRVANNRARELAHKGGRAHYVLMMRPGTIVLHFTKLNLLL